MHTTSRRYLETTVSKEAGDDHLRLREIRDIIDGALKAVEERIPDTVSQVVASYAANPVESIQVFIGELGLVSRWFTRIHELLVYLPRQVVTAATAALLSGCFGDVYRSQRPSIILGSLFNALEFDFFQLMRDRIPDLEEIVLEKTGRVVLQLSLCDRDAPPAWPILAHEMGHAVNLHTKLSQGVTDLFVKDPESDAYKVIASWCAELASDLIAAKALGPAPMMALLSLEYCIYPLRPVFLPSTTHPATRWRLLVVSEYLKRKFRGEDFLLREREAYELAWNLSVGLAVPDGASVALEGIPSAEVVAAARETDQNQFENLVMPLAKELEERVEKLQFPPFSLDRTSLARCGSRLKQGLPISAQGADRKELQDAIPQYRMADYSSETERMEAFRQLASKFIERPLPFPAIMLSCYEHRLEELQQIVDGVIRFDSIERVRESSRRLHQLDALVASSINTGTIHRTLLALDLPVGSQGHAK